MAFQTPEILDGALSKAACYVESGPRLLAHAAIACHRSRLVATVERIANVARVLCAVHRPRRQAMRERAQPRIQAGVVPGREKTGHRGGGEKIGVARCLNLPCTSVASASCPRHDSISRCVIKSANHRVLSDRITRCKSRAASSKSCCARGRSKHVLFGFVEAQRAEKRPQEKTTQFLCFVCSKRRPQAARADSRAAGLTRHRIASGGSATFSTPVHSSGVSHFLPADGGGSHRGHETKHC